MKILQEEERASISDLNLLICSSKDLDAFVNKANSSDLEVLTVKLVSPKLLEYLKECLKEEK